MKVIDDARYMADRYVEKICHIEGKGNDPWTNEEKNMMKNAYIYGFLDGCQYNTDSFESTNQNESD